MAEIFAIGFLENIKILIVAILIYAIIFALLKQVKIFGDSAKINSLIAFLSAIIVSFSGVVTYAVTYAINWFVIIFFIIFLLLVIMMFLGVKMSDIASKSKSNAKIILVIFGIFFVVIFFKSFFALNNAFDLNEPQNDSYGVDASFNTGVDDITNRELDEGIFYRIFGNIDPELLSAVIFLIVLGVFVFILGK